MLKKTARLVLEDGTQFEGYSFGAESSVSGEVVFSTAMTGYPESLTDPSYSGQILVMTYPLVGNYGVPGDDVENGLLKYFESDKVHIAGLVITDYSFEYSHWNAKRSLAEWLRQHGVPAIYGVDTRQITKIIRERGVMLGKIAVEGTEEPKGFRNPNTENLVAKVSCDVVIEYDNRIDNQNAAPARGDNNDLNADYGEEAVKGDGKKRRIVLVDCGCKYNIIRSLLCRDATVIRVPWDYDFTTLDYDGVMISNGPGDPQMCGKTIEHIKKAFEIGKPIFGICLGNQLLSLAAGATTYKLKYGHRSHNQPCIEAGTDHAVITSQNHGYVVNPDGLGADWEPYFTNLNDGTIEGIRHRSKPFCSVQFHPEATSGPVDTSFLFDQFIASIDQHKK